MLVVRSACLAWVRGTNSRLDETNSRLGETNSRLDETNTRLGAVETTLKDLVGQQLIRHDVAIDELRERVTRLETKVG